MIFLYTLALIFLGLVKLLVALRAAALERKYAAVAGAALKLANEPQTKPGNSGKYDAFVSAKRTYELGSLVQKRDALEGKYYRWRGWADCLVRMLNGLRAWKGKKLPYTLGALDIWLVLYLVDHLGMADFVSARRLMDGILGLIGK